MGTDSILKKPYTSDLSGLEEFPKSSVICRFTFFNVFAFF